MSDAAEIKMDGIWLHSDGTKTKFKATGIKTIKAAKLKMSIRKFFSLINGKTTNG